MPNEKKEYSDNVKCGHCQNIAPMERVARRVHEESFDNDYGGPPDVGGTILELLLCPSCDKPTLRTCDWGALVEPSLREDWTILYPEPQSVPSGMPDKVSTAYAAAGRVKGIEANAFGVLLGRVLDRVCEDKEAEGGTLNERLNNLAERDIIPRPLAEMAHRLRGLRNIGGHANLGELTAEEVPILNDLCRAVIEYVYSGPQLLARAQRRLDALRDRGD